MAGPYPYPEPYPPQYPPGGTPGYPGMLPPPVPYRKRRRGGLIAALVAAVLVVVAVVAGAIVLGTRDGGGSAAGGPLGEDAARMAIQNYLDALSDGDDETVARNTLCGMFDEVKEKRSDMALAGLASDAFRKQFDSAQVTSIDRIVPWSSNQLQVLFTMRVKPADRGTQSPTEDEQAVAQLLVQGKDVLVCSYLLRSGGSY